MPLTHELIPNLSRTSSPAFTKTDYDPGNKYSVPKDYGITSFYWMTDKVSEQPDHDQGGFELLKTPEMKDLKVNFLEGGTQVMALALGGARLLDQHREPGGDRRGQAAADRRQAERRHDQLDYIERGVARRDRLRHGLERRHPPRDRVAQEEGPRDGLPRARGLDGVLGRQLGHPRRRRASRGRAQVDRLRARARRGRPRDELPPVSGAGEGHQGRRARRWPRTR